MSWDIIKEPLFQKWKTWWIERHPTDIGEYSWEYLFTKGKQIRPRLFCELWTYLCPERPPCVELAFMIECAHVVSLILDDLPWMDNAETRRNMKTLHCQFSIRKALLLAHDVVELAYEVGKECPLLVEQKEFSDKWYTWAQEKAQILWYGQWLDLSKQGSLEELASYKTGVLFACVTELVAYFTGFDTIFWREWGKTLGILFQWVDDWDDQESDLQIQQRNAFNEAFVWTQGEYSALWCKIVQGIGETWWTQPFGSFLLTYFTRVGVSPSIPPLSSLAELSSLFSLSTSPFSLQDYQLSSCSTQGLEFMSFFLPYLTQSKPDKPIPDPSTVQWSLQHLWEMDEKTWMSELETMQELQPFLVPLRKLERMIQEIE